MPLARDEVLQALRRLLSNGRLDSFPKRDEDRQMLLALGAWRVREARRRSYLAAGDPGDS